MTFVISIVQIKQLIYKTVRGCLHKVMSRNRVTSVWSDRPQPSIVW